MNNERITFTYLTNCAVLLHCGEEKMLIDGIFSGKQQFDRMDSKIEDDIIVGRGEFAKIKYVLVTHCHNDHYNGSKILKFLEHHPGTVLFVPQNARLDEARLKNTGAQVIWMKEQQGELKRISFGNIRIEYMKTGHLTYKYPNHFCLNVLLENTNVLFTADMDLSCMELLEKFTKEENSFIFANAILLWHKKWRNQFLGLKYTNMWLYHLPSKERDALGYRKKTMVHWKNHKADVPNWTMLGKGVCEEENEIY